MGLTPHWRPRSGRGLRKIPQELGQFAQKHELGGMTDGDGNPAGVPIKIVISQDEANF